MLEHKLNDVVAQLSEVDLKLLNEINPREIKVVTKKMADAGREINEVKNMVSNPASPLNRVLDTVIQKVQDLEEQVANI